jgi:hypothetical protein
MAHMAARSISSGDAPASLAAILARVGSKSTNQLLNRACAICSRVWLVWRLSSILSSILLNFHNFFLSGMDNLTNSNSNRFLTTEICFVNNFVILAFPTNTKIPDERVLVTRNDFNPTNATSSTDNSPIGELRPLNKEHITRDNP